MAVFELHQINKNYGNRTILKTVQLQAHTGEIIGIFGRNGSGKTTLFNSITGQVKSNISLSIDGKSMAPQRLFLQQLAGYVPQESFLPAHIRLRDIISLYLKNEADQDRIYYDPMLSSLMKNRPGELSIGERKYAELLLVGYLRRPLLILDEPFTMLEPIQIEHAKELIKGWARHAIVLISDHYYAHVQQISSKNMILQDGVGHWVVEESDWKQFDYLNH